VAALLVRILASMRLTFDDVDPRSDGVTHSTSPSLICFGLVEFLLPYLDPARRRVQKKMKSWRMLMRFGSTTAATSGVGPSGPAIGDFPVARGLLSIQGMESRSDDAPPTAPWSTTSLSCSEAWVVIFFFSVVLSVFVPN
jgi:hypothetical protein